MPNEVILYYKFTHVANVAAFRDAHQQKCSELNLKGRVYIADEGINGTLAGSAENTALYRSYLRAQPGFADIQFKTDACEQIPFAKLKTKVRPFILNMGFEKGQDVDPSQTTATHLSPDQWRQVLETEKDFVLLDVRNNYESAIGHFEDAICPDLADFKKFPAWADELKEKYSDKKILMYCTGGIRCEKFSSLLLAKGMQNIFQLDGGILNYAKKEEGAHFAGRCFVFDDRLAVDIAKNTAPLTTCKHCGSAEDRYVNCANMDCNQLFIICDSCAQIHAGTCSRACQSAKNCRPFDPEHFRIPFRKKGIVFPELGRQQK